MSTSKREPSLYQRNAFAPGLLAAIALVVAPALMGGDWYTAVLFVVSILAIIVTWSPCRRANGGGFLRSSRSRSSGTQILPLPFAGPIWTAGHWVAAALFLVAGALIKTPRRQA